MHIDRARFSRLVTAISAATACPIACAASSAPEPGHPTLPAVVETTTDARAPTPAPMLLDAAAATAPASTDAVGGLGLWASAYDPVGLSKNCAMLRCGGPTSEGMWSLRKACKIYSELLRPEPFQRFMSCLMAQNNTRHTCDLELVTADPVYWALQAGT